MQNLTITALNIYPIKSMKGIAVDRARLTAAGLDRDRRWMVVRDNGPAVTQREIGRLALIETAMEPDGVRLTLHGDGTIVVPWNAAAGGRRISSRVWRDGVETVDEGDEISRWLTAALQSDRPLRLVRMAADFRRSLVHADRYGADATTYFADGAPFLIASEDSLAELNRALTSRGEDPVPMNRFRPNIVVKGTKPFAEHGMGRLQNGDYALELRYPCERCVVPTIDQQTGERNPRKQPFNTLIEINPMPQNPNAPAFAENAILAEGDDAVISVGDALTAYPRVTPSSRA